MKRHKRRPSGGLRKMTHTERHARWCRRLARWRRRAARRELKPGGHAFFDFRPKPEPVIPTGIAGLLRSLT